MAQDKYLMKVGIDLDEAQLNVVTGKISDQLVQMGEISDEFIDNALETARKYNEELDKQRKIVAEIDEKLKDATLDPATRKLLEETKKKSEGVIKDYTYGNAEKGLDSKAVVDAVADYAGAMKSNSKKVGEAIDGAVGKVGKFASVVSAAWMVIKSFVGKVEEALDNLSNYSNQLNPLGAFGSKSQRDLMSRYGMTGTQALGFQNVLDSMGMGESDLGRMTESQRKMFNELTGYWNDLMGQLDPDKLARYTETMDKYQEIRAKFDMGLQATVLKLVSESGRFEKLVDKAGDFMDVTLDFLGSPLVQTVFDGLLSFLTACVTILEKGMRIISAIPGFGSGGGNAVTNNNTTNNTNSTINIYGTDFHSNDELARQISYSNKGGYVG